MSDITEDQSPGEDRVLAIPAASSVYDELPDAPPPRKLKFTIVGKIAISIVVFWALVALAGYYKDIARLEPINCLMDGLRPVTDFARARTARNDLTPNFGGGLPAPRLPATGFLKRTAGVGRLKVFGRLHTRALPLCAHEGRRHQRDQHQPHDLEKVFIFRGLERLEVTEAQAGDIVAVTGPEGVSIGDTIASPETPEALPPIDIDEPTVRMTFGVSNSPFKGKEGIHCTSRNIHDRLNRELRTNVSLKVETTSSPDVFEVAGRGELHLSILVETMRREQFEFQVSRPEPVTKVIDGRVHEPYEILNISTNEEYVGVLTEYLSGRMAQLRDMKYDENGYVHMEYKIPTRGLIGFTEHGRPI